VTRFGSRQRGLTLIEMLIGLVIGLVVSLAALALYLALNDSSRVSRTAGEVNETGRLALEMLGRELQQAGFYPAQFPAGADPALASTIGAYFNGKTGRHKAFDSGLHGCDGAAYDPTAMACGPHRDTGPDAIVFNHFAEPARALDCNRRPVSTDPDNATRVATRMPLFVSNRFVLATVVAKDAKGGESTARVLACHGNGDEANAGFTTQLPGVEDLIVRYGLHSGTTASQSPEQFLSASGVEAQPTIDGVSPWQRVTAVKLCVLVRSTAAVRAADKTAREPNGRDCRGAELNSNSADHHLYKRFERVFAVRNNLTGTL
jgi:type IV pilus assembly protein PilW